MRSFNKLCVAIALTLCTGMASNEVGQAQLVASPGILEGEQLKRINDIYAEVTSSASGQAGKLIPAFLDSLSNIDARGLSQTYHQFKDLLSDPSVVEALVQALKTNRAEIASNILTNGRHYGGTTLDFTVSQIQELVMSLTSANANVRKNVVQLLSSVSPPNDNSVQMALINVMQTDPSALVRAAAASSLSQFGREVYFKNATPIAEAYAKVLSEDASVQVRSAAASGLSQMGGKAGPAAAAVCKALTDNSAQVRTQVLQTIINLGPACKSSLNELIDMWNAPPDPYNHQGKERIAQAFAAIGEQTEKTVPLIASLLKDHNTLSGATRSLTKMGPLAAPAVPELIKALASAYAYDREEVSRTLGTIGPAAKAAVEPLKKSLKDERATGGYGTTNQAKQAAREAIMKISGEVIKDPTNENESRLER